MTVLLRALLMAGLLIGSARAIPPNDDCDSPTVISFLPFGDTQGVSSATSSFVDDPGLPCLDLDLGIDSVWYQYTAPTDVVVAFSTEGSDYDTAIHVLAGQCTLHQTVGCVDDALDIDPQGRVYVALESGQTVLIEVVGNGDTGTLVFSADYAPEGQPGLAGPEFLVNTTEPGDQGYYFFRDATSVCADDAGDFVVVWEADHAYYGGGQDGDRAGVFGRRFAADGTPKGGEFQVNTYTTYQQERPEVACDAGGGFAVTWGGFGAAGRGVHARRFDATGAPVTGEIDVEINGESTSQAVASAADGDFVVAFTQNDEIYARQFSAAGVPAGATFQVNTYTTGIQDRPDVAARASGDFVVVWEDVALDEDVRARLFDAGGTPAGSDFVVNEIEPGSRGDARVGMAADGRFVVSWLDNYADATVRARRFDASGVAQGPTIGVNTYTSGNQFSADLAVDESANFLVVWDEVVGLNGAFARRFDAAGNPTVGPEFRVETVTTYRKYAPHAASQGAGDFVVVFTGYDGQDAYGTFYGGYGVRAQRFRTAGAPPEGCPAAPLASCKQPTIDLKGTIVLKDKTPDKNDSLVWKWLRGEATTPAEIGDPLATDTYSFCLYDGDGELLSEAQVPPGGTCGTQPCWKPLGTDGFRYKNKAGTFFGVQKMVLKSGADGAAKVLVKGKGDALVMPTLGSLTLPLRAQVASTTGTCWEARFESGGVVQDTTAQFSAKASAD